ncbi:MAG: AMP-binding protein [Actinomycetota bacterium]
MWSLLETRAATHGDAPFVTWQPFDEAAVTYSYVELARQAAAVGAGLSARGVSAGDRVLIHLENCPEFIVAWFGCAAIGAVAVTTNSRSAVDEMAYYADHCGAVGAITQPKLAEIVGKAAPNIGWIAVIDHDQGVPAGPGSRPDGTDRFDALLGDPDDLVAAPIDPAASMSVQYTSGTTSRPKGVLWTHANALWGAKVTSRNQDLRPSDCHLIYMPLFHTNALGYSLLPTLWTGGRCVLIPKWSTSRFWDISLRHQCTWASLIGLSIQAIRQSEIPDGHSYRMFGSGVCDVPILPEVPKLLGWWGMTETITQPIVGDPNVPNRPLSMGRASPEYGIAVVRDDGSNVEPDETGNLLVYGTPGLSLFAEYLFNPEATRDSFDERGWFRTGDLVTPHADGHITFADRAKDMLKVGAENVAASEIERVIMEVPGVLEAAAVGRPDAALDEVPVVFAMGDADPGPLADAILDTCRRKLADFKVPRDVYVMRELPRSTLRKVNKAALRAVVGPDADRSAAEAQWIEQSAIDPSGEASSTD